MEFSKCRLCGRFHSLPYCHAFKAMTPEERYDSAKMHRYCLNCLATSHKTEMCDCPDSCHRCGKAHHTLLHRSASPAPDRRRKEELRKKTGRREIASTSRAIQKPTKRIRDRKPAQQRITDFFSQAVLTLEKLKQLLHIAPTTAGRHVENMSTNLIDF